MHGRLKVKSTAEQAAEKKKEKEKKLAAYLLICEKFFHKKGLDEYDDESNTLSKKLLLSNPDFYTVWNFRKKLFLSLKEKSSEDSYHELCLHELELTESCLRDNPKSYGSWHHRCWIMMSDPQSDWERELKLCKKYLKIDDRNFHCWDYRRFIVNKRNFPIVGELEFTMDLIHNNFSNYSSWQYRSKLLPQMENFEKDILLSELDLVQNAAFTDPNDQSGWLYYQWLLGKTEKKLELMFVHCDPDIQIIMLCYSLPINYAGFKKQLLDADYGEWHSPDDCTYSSLWYSKLDKTSEFLNIKLNNGEAMKIDCSKSAYFTINVSTWFLQEISSHIAVYLSKELHNYEELLLLEPDSKWAVLTTTHIMKQLDSQKSVKEKEYSKRIIDSYEKLIELDPYRKSYYSDMKSKEIMEKKLMETASESTSKCIDLSACNLSSIHYSELLSPFKEIKMSSNNLSYIDTKNFLCCQKLQIDHNNFNNCKDFQMDHLECLDISHNKIKKHEDLVPLACKELNTLIICGNPICHDEAEISHLRAALPNVDILTE